MSGPVIIELCPTTRASSVHRACLPRAQRWKLSHGDAVLDAPDTPDAITTNGVGDRASLAVLLSCGPGGWKSRRSRWTISSSEMDAGASWDLVGKHGPVRTVPVPTWVKVRLTLGPVRPSYPRGCTPSDQWRGSSTGRSCGALLRRLIPQPLYIAAPLAISLAAITAGDMRDMFNGLKSA
jgi:hypothetical protein